MGLVNKLKSILFEEEEVEIPVLEKKEKNVVSVAPVASEMPKQVETVKPTSDYQDFYQEEQKSLPKREVVPSKPVQTMDSTPEMRNDRPVFQKESSFNFPDFDEEEFESALPRRSTNVIEHERKKELKKKEYVNPSKKMETQEVKAKFKPSPIISPVYGILDKNYTPDDITTRIENETPKVLDVDSVRKKAFGTLELDEKKEINNVSSKSDFDDEILEERLEKARTIDELLKDSSDDVIDVSDTEEIKTDPLDEAIESLEEKENKKEPIVEDESLESDLFDLIDSMYENREDGE